MDDKGQLTGVLPRLEVLAPARVAPTPARVATPPARVAPSAAPAQPNPGSETSAAVPPSSSLDFREREDSPERSVGGFGPTLMAMPSWLVSFIVHLTLLLVLATCTLVAHHDGPIFLEFSQTPVSNEPSVMEVSIEEPASEDPFESLESDDALVMDLDLPPVDLQEHAKLPEMFDEIDAFDVSGLPEFSSEPVVVKKAASQKGNESTEFFGTPSYGSDFVFVIDCSDSMSREYRWERAVKELVATLEQLDKKQKFLVMLYNTQSYMMFGAPDDQKLIAATEANKRRIKTWLNSARPFSGTRPAKSMQLALRKKPDAIYFLSDGELRDDTMFGLRTWNVARKDPDGIKRLTPIHTILLGSNFGRQTMKTIADENNGIFTHVR